MYKGIVSAISSDPPCKEGNASYLQRYPLKRCLIKHKLVSHVFVYVQIVYFHLGFLFKSDLRISSLQEIMEKITEINTFRVMKTTFSFPGGSLKITLTVPLNRHF